VSRLKVGNFILRLSGVAAVTAAAFYFLSQFQLIPQNISLEGQIGYGLVFLLGLAASVSTCVAVTGGVLVSLAAKYDERNAHLSAAARFVTHVYFNTGRILSYTVFGALIGLAGSALTLSPTTYGVVTVGVSVLMFVLGLRMLGLLPRTWQFPTSRAFREWSDALAQRNSATAAFFLGALTFFLPCGFTQALQLYVLAKAEIAAGALTMFVFALGTLPVLLGISFASSFSTGSFKYYFFRAAGAAVIVLAVFNLEQGLRRLDISPGRIAELERAAVSRIPIENGRQIARMKIVGLEYLPNQFVVSEGIPVEWEIDAREAEGCGRLIVVPRLKIARVLPRETAARIQFTPDAVGEISFNCGMNMMTPDSKFLVTPR
jgi:uncharacterized protein